ncbi:MAG: Asp23/Gls24 family envelope stress response protein [Acidaminococcaceae bacterium]
MDEDQEIVKTKLAEVDQGEIPEDVGSVKVADEVISIVAGLAAAEVPGVAGMSAGLVGGIVELLGKKNFSKGVNVLVEGKTVTVEIYAILEYGVCIPEIAITIQEKVKEAVENMTGFEVAAVDIHVQGIVKRQKTSMENSDRITEELGQRE